MNHTINAQGEVPSARARPSFKMLFAAGVSAILFAMALSAEAQITNAFDQATDSVYAGLGAPNGLGGGGQNGGFGFGAWTFSVTGTGGSFIENNGPSGNSFDLWNVSANSRSVALRPLTPALTPGQSFSVQLRLNGLDSNSTTNMFALQDATGNTLFAYWHVGNESNANDGWYSDATTSEGVAANFQYAYQQFVTYTFTLTSPTNYTFTDEATGASFSGTIPDAAISRVAFIRANGNFTPPNGQDFQFDQLLVTGPPSSSPFDRSRIAFDAYNNAFYAEIAPGKAHYTVSQYNTGSGYNYFWGQAEEIEGAIDAYERNPNPRYLSVVTNLLNGFSNDNGTDWSWNEYNDDIMWACIAYLRGYQHTGNTTFLNIAKANFDMMYARAWDTVLGGGLYWKTTNAEKNAAVNGPAVIAAYYLYEALGDAGYLTKAQNIFNWEKAVLFNATTGAVYDGIKTSGFIETFATTYNQGTFVAAADLLGDITNAVLASDFTMNNMGNENSSGYKIMYEYGTDNNNSGFNGIGIRWIAKFMKNRNFQYRYLPWLQANADAAWNVRRTTDNLSWCEWLHPTPTESSLLSWDCISSMVALQAVPSSSNANAPVFTVQPVSQVSAAGNTVVFSVVATNGAPISYQWFHDNNLISGANGTNLALINISPGDAGYYWVQASNSTATAYSQVATLNLIGSTSGIFAQDSASNYAVFAGNEGFGFEPWMVSTSGGGSYISGDTPPLFALWNNTSAAQSTASRKFSMAMPAGSSFHVQLQMNILDTAGNRNGFELQDAEGNVLFSYWHRGGDSSNGHYMDAGTSDGTAVGFAYDYGQLDSFKFTLNSATTYTFHDLSTSASFSGTIDNAAISGVTFFRTNGSNTPSNGQDFKFTDLILSMPPTVPGSEPIAMQKTALGWSLTFAVAPGYTYRVQRSSDLVDDPWTEIGTLIGPATGIAQFIDTNSPTDRAFYRTVTP